MGILDSKTRVLDTVVTLEGRRQLVNGGLRIKYVSFTDGATFYKADAISGSADASARLYLEASNLPQDQVTFLSDDSGRLLPFNSPFDFTVKDSQLIGFSYPTLTSTVLSAALSPATILSGAALFTSGSMLLSSSIRNFQQLYTISTHDKVFEDNDFELGPSAATFVVSNDSPIPNADKQAMNVNQLESIFNDTRFSHMLNFKYLPPINKRSPSDNGTTKLGNYPPWGCSEKLDYATLVGELRYFEDLGLAKIVTFNPTSSTNRLLAQFFELGNNTLTKLDVVDFGTHMTGDNDHPNAHILFVGKVIIDEAGTQTFIHIFTLVFD